MSRLRATDPVWVSLGPCECPDTPHDEDEAFLRPRLTVEDALDAMGYLASDQTDEQTGTLIAKVFLRGIESWNIQNDEGEIIPLSAIWDGSLEWATTLKPIADAAADLYGEELYRPLVKARQASSRNGQTVRSTSVKRVSKRKRRAR